MTKLTDLLEPTITEYKVQRIANAFAEVADAFAAARLFTSSAHYRKLQENWEGKVRNMIAREEKEDE